MLHVTTWVTVFKGVISIKTCLDRKVLPVS